MKKECQMQTAIDYEKYSNMNIRQLTNSLLSAEKQEQKIKEQMQQKQELISFLKAKIKESLDKPKQNFIPLEQTESYKEFQKMKAEMSEQEIKKLKAEVEKEINMDYGDEV